MASGEDKALEDLLDYQLKDQRESLSAIEEALASDPSNPELLSVTFLLQIRSLVSWENITLIHWSSTVSFSTG